jgi:hypothetical protein
MPLKKARAKKTMRILSIFVFVHFFVVYDINEFEIGIKFCVF